MTVALHKPWTPLSETSGSAAVMRGLQNKIYDQNYTVYDRGTQRPNLESFQTSHKI